MFEFGLIQEGHTPLENYKLNRKLLQKIKPKEVEIVIISHCHQDHMGLAPALYSKRNCNAIIIAPKNSKPILREMWRDCAYINARDVEILNRFPDRNYEPYYNDDDIEYALQHVMEIESDKIINITDELAVRFKNAGHIFLSKQAEIYINGGSNTKKIAFTGDIGNVLTQDSRVFVENFEPIINSQIVFGECTYGNRDKEINKKVFKEDMNKLRTVIEQYCVEQQHRVLIPTFALDRMPYIIWLLYTMFGNDDSFNIPVLIDSPLANRLLDCYCNLLEDEAKDKFDKMMSWKNIRCVIEADDSKAAIQDKGAKIILSSSGMLTAGRSIKWTQSILPNENDCILFVGFATPSTLAYKIKHDKENKTININGKPYKNKAAIYDLHSFSSHMQYNDLIKYYKSINAEKIYLVHSNMNDKIEFKKDLEEAIAKELKTTRVIAVNKGMKISL